jgi:hypothetical protein
MRAPAPVNRFFLLCSFVVALHNAHHHPTPRCLFPARRPAGAAAVWLLLRANNSPLGRGRSHFSVSARLNSSSPDSSSLCFVLSVSTGDVLGFSLSSAPLVSLFPLFRRKPYIRLQILQEPIPRTGVAINDQPQKGLWPVPRLPVRRRKSMRSLRLGRGLRLRLRVSINLLFLQNPIGSFG